MIVTRPSASRFAAALAERLDHVVPSGLSVCARGSSVAVHGPGAARPASEAAEIVSDEDGRALADRIETAARAILNGVQDEVMEILTEQWPAGLNGSAVYPNARVEGDQLLMWFGEEPSPVIVLPPLPVADVMESTS